MGASIGVALSGGGVLVVDQAGQIRSQAAPGARSTRGPRRLINTGAASTVALMW